MKPYPTFHEEAGDQSGGGGTQQTTDSSAGQQQVTDDGNAGTQGGAFDPRSLVTDDGKFVENWTEKLPEDLKPFSATLGKYPNMTELFRGFGNAAKMVGAKTQGIVPPGPDAKPEEIAEFHKALGVPESPDGYGLTKPEQLPEGVKWNEDEVKAFSEFAHKQGLLPAQAKALVEFDLQRQQALVGKASANIEAFVAKQRDELKAAWGDKFDENVDRAKAAATALGLDINDPELGNSAKVIQALHRASLLIREDKLATGDKAGFGATNKEQIEQIRRSDEYLGNKGPELQQAAAARIAALSGAKL